MVRNERLIRFFMPVGSELINQPAKLPAYCVCYQYDFDLNGYGPYGFETDKSQLIIRDTFQDVYCCQEDGKGDFFSVFKENNTNKKSLYLYGNGELISALDVELKKYRLAIAKNNIKARHLLPSETLPSKPLLLDVRKDGIYQSEVLEVLIKLNCGVFIRHSYTPEAGEVFILFDESVWDEFKSNAIRQKIEILEVLSVNDLKSW